MIYREGTLDSRYPKKQTRKLDQIISNISVNACSILLKSYSSNIFFSSFVLQGLGLKGDKGKNSKR